jgi:hypothetical protein
VRFSLLSLSDNVGPLSAVLRVLQGLKGNFIVFVDSDDVLYPDFISSHVQVHLALPAPVAMTSSDVIETDAVGRVHVSGRYGFAAGCESFPRGLKPRAVSMRIGTVTDAQYEALSAATIAIPHYNTRWVWAPSTANMYRKSLVDTVVPAVTLAKTVYSNDAYFIPILHMMTGSVLILRQLSAYRLHDQNVFANQPLLQGIQQGRDGQREKDVTRQMLVLHTMTTRAKDFDRMLAGNRYWTTLDLLSGLSNMAREDFYGQEEARDVLIEALPSLIDIFGRRETIARLCERMHPDAAWDVIRPVNIGRPSIPVWRYFALKQAQHLLKKIKSFIVNRDPLSL